MARVNWLVKWFRMWELPRLFCYLRTQPSLFDWFHRLVTVTIAVNGSWSQYWTTYKVYNNLLMVYRHINMVIIRPKSWIDERCPATPSEPEYFEFFRHVSLNFSIYFSLTFKSSVVYWPLLFFSCSCRGRCSQRRKDGTDKEKADCLRRW